MSCEDRWPPALIESPMRRPSRGLGGGATRWFHQVEDLCLLSQKSISQAASSAAQVCRSSSAESRVVSRLSFRSPCLRLLIGQLISAESAKPYVHIHTSNAQKHRRKEPLLAIIRLRRGIGPSFGMAAGESASGLGVSLTLV